MFFYIVHSIPNDTLVLSFRSFCISYLLCILFVKHFPSLSVYAWFSRMCCFSDFPVLYPFFTNNIHSFLYLHVLYGRDIFCKCRKVKKSRDVYWPRREKENRHKIGQKQLDIILSFIFLNVSTSRAIG
ncbi:uncharacterized protein NESG_01281 [Nematocida ausubeli]|uniref:Uncharacterized protein n=1 Tax=Nematocida ausubeli (strain ATCC PRA-371 / ERTm2) TaxID=1913371 RepID=A0A086J1Z7_NEMA1|nr:uncharacterized protein NESG_01281 [Nematocida ausubeli]KFG26165.1 hypothetical protein NESG_01281 [Nematocida ausubeli]